MSTLSILRTGIILSAFAIMPAAAQDSFIEVPADNAGVQEPDTTKTAPEAATADAAKPFPYSPDSICERVVPLYGKRTLRLPKDKSFSLGAENKKNCFIVMSKKDYYLYVYEKRAGDTVLVARYDCAFALRKGNKQKTGDMKTPHCTRAIPAFSISQICPASSWRHDFGDGRGNILAYGSWFLRLNIGTSNRSICIHGSTNNRESVPGRASEGCIRLKDEDIADLKSKYVFVGMKVIIKDEQTDDYPFEIRAMRKLGEPRLRHLDPKKTLTNEQIATAKTAKK